MTAQDRADGYKTKIADLPMETLRTFDTPERDQYWQWLVENIGFANLESYLEIGSNCGHSLWMTAPFCRPDARIVTIDLGNGASGQPQAWKKTCDKVGAIALKCSSRAAAPIVAFQSKFDLVLIDADHKYEGVFSDWFVYRHVIKRGGFVVFHDTRAQSMGVHRLWSEIKSQFTQTWEIGDRQGIGIGRMAL